MNVTFAGYPSDDVGYRLLHLADGDTSSVLERTDGSTTTNGTGFAQIQMLPTRGNWYGISVFKDVDASGTLSTGDTVWGAGSGSYSYFSYDATKPIGDSVTIAIDDWDTYGGTTTGTY